MGLRDFITKMPGHMRLPSDTAASSLQSSEGPSLPPRTTPHPKGNFQGTDLTHTDIFTTQIYH